MEHLINCVYNVHVRYKFWMDAKLVPNKMFTDHPCYVKLFITDLSKDVLRLIFNIFTNHPISI